MSDTSDHASVRTLLPEYVGGTLDAVTRFVVEDHLAQCPRCSQELATWHEVGQVLRDASHVDAPPTHVLAAVLAQLAVEEGSEEGQAAHALSPARRWMSSYIWKVVREQARLVQGSTWLASALVMALGWVVAASSQEAASAALVLQLVAPVVAACGVSVMYGPETDPYLEVVLATPASPRLLLLARLAVVFGYDFVLALLATIGLTALGDGRGVWSLTQDWLGPMLFLSTLALVLAQRLGPSGAMSVALLLWGTRVGLAANGHIGLFDSHLALVLASAWSTNALTVAGGLALLGVALVSVRPRPRDQQGWRSVA